MCLDIANKSHGFSISSWYADTTAKVLCDLFVNFQQSIKSHDAMQAPVREYPAAILNVYASNWSKI